MNDGPEVTEITVEVFHPTEHEPITKSWSWTTKVGDAATEAAGEFDEFANVDSATFRNEDGEILKREKTLRAAGVEDGDELELVDTTGGVA